MLGLFGMSIVAGGRDNLGEILKSVEIIFLASRSLGKAEDMLKPRSHFNLIALGSMILALGGHNETSIEMWEGVSEPWKESSMHLENPRSRFSALTLTSSVCSTGSLPPHSCPTVDGDTCVFPFTNGWSMLQKCNHNIFLQDLKLTLPVSVKIMARASGVLLPEKDGPSVTLGNAL